MFEPGKSGNPSGRPKVPQEVKDAFKALAPKAIATLEEIMESGDKNSDRVKAAEIILDRAYGKAVQAVDMTGGISVAEVDTSKMDKKSQEAILTALVGLVGTQSEDTGE